MYWLYLTELEFTVFRPGAYAGSAEASFSCAVTKRDIL